MERKDRGLENTVIVFRERQTRSWLVFVGELSRFDKSQNVKMSSSSTVKLPLFENSRNVEMTVLNSSDFFVFAAWKHPRQLRPPAPCCDNVAG
jgi:hypothetical protein